MTSRIGPYSLIAELGRGAMGVVYRALDERLGREVALKVLWPHLGGQPGFSERFEREARSQARVHHPNVVNIYEVGESDGYHYLVTELVEGTTLRERMDAGRLEIEEALSIFAQILSGLDAAHTAGLVHRDLKPGNVLIETSSGGARIADFGLARVSDEATALTAAGEILGTAEYLAPEIARGESASQRSDLYAAGVILYRMLTGRLPFEGTTPGAILDAHQRGRYDPPTRVTPELSITADRVMSRFIARDVEDRYANCQAAITDVEQWRRGEDVLPGLPISHEAIDEGISRRPPAWWRAIWNRIDIWMRFQCLAIFGRTEQTVFMVRSFLREEEVTLRDAHRRLEEALHLRERLRRDVDAMKRETSLAESAAETALTEGREESARELLAKKVKARCRSAELEPELVKIDALVMVATQAYERTAEHVVDARHRSDLLLSRRRRARIEIAIFGAQPGPALDRWLAAGRIVAAAIIVGVLLAAAKGAWTFFSAPTVERQRPAMLISDSKAKPGSDVATGPLPDTIPRFELLHDGRIRPGIDAEGMMAVDLDCDGDSDLLVFRENGTNFWGTSLYPNDGTGHFGSPKPMPLLPIPQGIAVGDVDGDGDPDVLVSLQRLASIFPLSRVPPLINDGVGLPDATFPALQTRLFVNDGGGNLADATLSHLPVALTTSLNPLLFDANGDGSLDIFMPWSCQGDSWPGQDVLYLNDGSGHFKDVTQTNLPSTKDLSPSAAVGDIDGDGDMDIIVNVRFGRNQVLINDGTGRFHDEADKRWPEGNQEMLRPAILLDIDRDGDIDFMVGTQGPYENQAPGGDRLYRNDGAGHFTDATNGWMPDLRRSGMELSAVGDLNGDGYPEVLMPGQRQAGSTFREGILYSGGPRWVSDVTPDVIGDHSVHGLVSPAQGRGPNARSCAFFDLDGDGDLDIAMLANGFGIQFWRNPR